MKLVRTILLFVLLLSIGPAHGDETWTAAVLLAPSATAPIATDILPIIRGAATNQMQYSQLVTAQVVNATYNLSTATGTQTISGFSFTPNTCDGFGSVAGLSTQYTTLNAHVDPALSQGSLYFGLLGNIRFSSSAFFLAVDSNGNDFQTGTITGYGVGFVTISWVKTGSPVGIFNESLRCSP